jgi:signal transduction histidine kinase
MSILSTIAIVMASIAFYAGVYQLTVYLRTRKKREDLTFALLSFAVCIYDLFSAGLYSAESFAVGAFWQRAQVIALAFVSAAFLWFIYDYTGQLSRRVILALTIFFVLTALAGIFIHNESTWVSSAPMVKSFALPGGLQVTYYEASPGWIINLQTLVGLFSTGYIIWGAVQFYRRQPGRKAFYLILALGIFTLGALNDTAVSLGAYQFPYLIEYAYLAIIFLMVYSLSEEVIEATFVQRKLSASEQKFNNIIEASPMGIHLYKLEEDGKLIFIGANPAADAILDVDHRQFIGKTIEESFRSLEGTEVPERYREVCLDGKPWSTEQISYQDHHIQGYFEVHAFRTAPGMMAAIFMDVTERRNAEAALRERQEAIVKLTAELEQRVADRTAELELKNRELETFSFSVSHDLKAPLRAIDGYSRILQESHADRLDEDGRSCLNSIRGGVDRMNRLIDDLLAYSRLERRVLVKDSVDLVEIVEPLIAERSNEIDTRKVRLMNNCPSMLIHTEAEGLTQALRNLLDNALKFTRDIPQPSIEIGGQETDQAVVLWVKDNGIGFDMQYHDRIFEIFQRLHRIEDFPGTGIGLAIVSKVMQRLGGRAWAESVPGAGAAFFLEIPK